MSGVRRRPWDTTSLIASGLSLAAVVAAIATGVAPRRWWSVACFLGIGLASASYVIVVKQVLRRRALRLRSLPIQPGVRLTRPMWIPLREACALIGIGAVMAAIPAAIGFASVGLGVLLTVAVIGLLIAATTIGSARGLTFESSGLRILVSKAQLFVPWTSVISVEVTGPDHNRSSNLRVAAPRQIIASLSPDTRRGRMNAELLLGLGEPRGEAFHFAEWTAGLDADTLVRAIREATGAGSRQAN